MLHDRNVQCPYCGERFDTTVDASAGGQHYVEDCRICCRPIEVMVSIDEDGGKVRLELRRDDD